MAPLKTVISLMTVSDWNCYIRGVIMRKFGRDFNTVTDMLSRWCDEYIHALPSKCYGTITLAVFGIDPVETLPWVRLSRDLFLFIPYQHLFCMPAFVSIFLISTNHFEYYCSYKDIPAGKRVWPHAYLTYLDYLHPFRMYT